jgi:PmbA protein
MFKGMVAIGAEKDVRGSVQTGSVLIDQMKIAGS